MAEEVCRTRAPMAAKVGLTDRGAPDGTRRHHRFCMWASAPAWPGRGQPRGFRRGPLWRGRLFRMLDRGCYWSRGPTLRLPGREHGCGVVAGAHCGWVGSQSGASVRAAARVGGFPPPPPPLSNLPTLEANLCWSLLWWARLVRRQWWMSTCASP